MVEIKRKPIIGVMGSHEREQNDLAEPIGTLIADMDYHLLTGAGGGVMTSVARAFTAKEERVGNSIGVVPTMDYDGSFIPREMYPNPYIELPIITPLGVREQNASTPYSRNYVNIMSSHGLIFLPGGQGTQTECALAIRYKKPMILFGPHESFKAFPEYPTRVQDIDEVREFLDHISSRIRTEEAERDEEFGDLK